MFFSLFFCYISCIVIDPIKRAFFLVISLVFFAPVLSFINYIWFSYFVCLIFLRGVFVIVVYFSSISTFFRFDYGFGFWIFIISIFIFLSGNFVVFFNCLNSLNFIYNSIYRGVFVWIIICLLLFINFISFFLNFSGALRKL